MDRLIALWPYLLIGCLMLAALIVIWVFVLLSKAKSRQTIEIEEAPAPKAVPEPEDASSTPAVIGLRRSFRVGLKRLRGFVSGWDRRYQIPWFLLVGASGSRSGDLLSGAGLNLPFGAPQSTSDDSGCDWWFFDRGIMLEVGGDHVLRRDGVSADERGWRALLRLLEKHRPHRPIDGVVLSISCAELLAASNGGVEETLELRSRAGKIYQILWQTQRRLGIRFPVYLVITGCERLGGFTSFCQALPPESLDGMLGWSSPYDVDTTFRVSWVDEAMASLGKRLNDLQMEIFAERPEAADSDEVFEFPTAVARLGEPLRLALSELFKPSAYHESMLVRGLYLTGHGLPLASALDGELVAEPPHGLDRTELRESVDRSDSSTRNRRSTFFLHDLLRRKVFPEAVLAAPTSATLISKNRTVRAVQVGLVLVSLLLGLGVWRAHERLKHTEQELKPFLTKMVEYVGEVRERRRNGHVERALVEDAVYHLLGGMSRINAGRFGSIFLPTSWVSPFNTDLRHAMIASYDDVIFDALFFSIDERAADLTSNPGLSVERRPASELLLSGTSSRVNDNSRVVTPIHEMPEFRDLERFVDDLAVLEANIDTYNELTTSRNLERFGQLVEYLFGAPLPEGFSRNAWLYQEALAGVDYKSFRPERYQEAGGEQAYALAERFYQALFYDGDLIVYLDRLASDLDRVAFQSISANDGARRFEETIRSLDLIQRALSQSDLEWAFRPRFELGTEFDRLVLAIERSDFLGEGIAREIRERGQRSFEAFRESLPEFESQITQSSFLALDNGEARMGLSPDTVVLKAALETFLDQPFLQLDENETRRVQTEFPPTERLLWSADRLNEAADLFTQYQQFLTDRLDLYPPKLQPALEGVARYRLGEKIANQIASAQAFEQAPENVDPILWEDDLRVEIESFGAAVQPLNKLVTTFEKLRLWPEAQSLEQLVAGQGFDLLEKVDDLLVAESLYRPRPGGFSEWRGDRSVIEPAFGVRDADELAEVLGLRRERLNQLAQGYAKPLVTWLGEAGVQYRPAQRPLYQKWTGIVSGLYAYEGQKPGNALAQLEEFILADLGTARLENCFDVAGEPARRSGASGYFAGELVALRRSLARRCEQVIGQRAAEVYREMAELFNQRLAGRFPFADVGPDVFAAEADPSDLTAFFRLFDAGMPVIRAVPSESASLGVAREEIRDFIDRMTEVRAFLAPYLDSEEELPGPVYKVGIDFRTDRNDEVLGDKIIGWTLAIDEQTVGFRDLERTATWKFKDEVELKLRWADDADLAPAVDEPQDGVITPEGDVVFTQKNSWSLLALLARYGPKRLAGCAGKGAPIRLALETVTRRSDIENARTVTSKVFVRISLSAPETATPLCVPPFPVRAPRLANLTARVSDSFSTRELESR